MRTYCRKFLESLPPLNYNVFVYMLSFFREVLVEEAYNRYQRECLANIVNIIVRSTPAMIANICIQYMGITISDELSKDERSRRVERQNFLQPVLVYLLTTTSSL